MTLIFLNFLSKIVMIERKTGKNRIFTPAHSGKEGSAGLHKEGVFVINELNITNEEVTENAAEAFAGEGKGVADENKIIPIANKSNSAESGNGSGEAEPAAQVNISDTGAQAGSAPEPTPVQPTAQSPQGAQATQAASNAGAQPGPEPGYRREAASYREDSREDFGLDEEERPKKRFWRFRAGNDEETRDKLILSRIRDEDLMEYLALEQRRLEFLQQSKEAKEKRILIAFQLLISLAAIVALTYLLQDNPTILISILYVAGIVGALHVWRNPQDRRNNG